ncbi:HTH_Tnp_Tc3_2 domain-containing protein [Trichonephila clavipes]|nr:HTH_Tnp_Tc3_2 domain-containing protein [Trichonephila clavipes]
MDPEVHVKEKAGRRTVLLARWIVRSVPLEIVGSSGHEKVPTCGKPGLERPGRPRGERIEGSCGTHRAEANHKSKRPFLALPLTPAHRQLRLQWCQARSMWNVTDWQNVVFSDEPGLFWGQMITAYGCGGALVSGTWFYVPLQLAGPL